MQYCDLNPHFQFFFGVHQILREAPRFQKYTFFAVALNGLCCVFIPKRAMKMFSFGCMWLMPKRDQWPVSNCSNKRSFQKQINQQISWRPTLSIWGEFGTVSTQLYLLLRQRTSFHRKDSRFFLDSYQSLKLEKRLQKNLSQIPNFPAGIKIPIMNHGCLRDMISEKVEAPNIYQGF